MRFSRRTLLRGLGTAIALPALEAMSPARAFGATAAAPDGPKRLAWLYVPNGVDMTSWKPAAEGASYQLTPTLQPLAAFKDRFMVISGLACTKANANGDGPGDHARAQAAYLTGVQPTKSESNIHLGISADQAAAAGIGHFTKFPSLELGMEEGPQGRCDSGYSCAYQHNLSWRNETTPMGKDSLPQSVFDRLFGNGNAGESAAARARQQEKSKSVLDFVLADAKSLQNKMGAADQRKIDEYLTAIREIEGRLSQAKTEAAVRIPVGAERPPSIDLKGSTKKVGVSTSSTTYEMHLPLMLDMMVLAFQADLTRVVTLPFADEESNQSYPWAGANVPHHGTSHHMGDASKIAMLAKINLYHMNQVAYLLQKLDKIKEGNGSVLDNCLIAYGSGNSDGQRHNHDNLPLLLMGKGGGTVKTGRHVQFAANTPITNLWLSMLQTIGVQRDRLGDSNGKIALT